MSLPGQILQGILARDRVGAAAGVPRRGVPVAAMPKLQGDFDTRTSSDS